MYFRLKKIFFFSDSYFGGLREYYIQKWLKNSKKNSLVLGGLKASKLKEKTKTKKNQSPDPAILGRVRTQDPDPDHFGPDFDSGSGYGSAFTDL